MKLDRFRAPALAAAAVLMISGAGIAFAGAPTVETKSTGPDKDTLQVQEGDQTTSDNHGLVVSQAAKVVSTTGKAHGAAVSAVARENVGKPAAEGSETKGTEIDLPGGHEDQDGVDVDHQFDGEE